MIKDKLALKHVQEGWTGVEILREKLQRSAMASASMPVAGGIFPFALADAAHNLPFIHAYGVLNEVLLQLKVEGHFTSRHDFLGPLVKSSKQALPWQDYALIKKGVDLRNGVAHKGKLLKRGDCWKYIDGIETELSTWGMI